ncbi:hypothetical protein ACRAWC_22685 [Leifsonia sp. L25]|uniref:hypothetical protein n=1 Tax=Leifsonia sp. L25 TaxID=3423957 RepID=UPI003D6920F1
MLLWFKAWDPAGLPPELTVRDAVGRPVAVDPSNPAYLTALAEQVTRMVSPDGLDADGFKVDFTQRAPSGVTLRTHDDGVWGISALHAIVRTIHDAAKAAKPDALVVTHTVHPSFSGVTDMVRLNDVLEDSAHGDPVPVGDQLRYRHDIAAALAARPLHRHRPVADAESGGVARLLAHPAGAGRARAVLRRVDRQQPRGGDGRGPARDRRAVAVVAPRRPGRARRARPEGADDRMSTFTEVAPASTGSRTPATSTWSWRRMRAARSRSTSAPATCSTTSASSAWRRSTPC